MKTVTYTEMDWHEFESLVEEKYNVKDFNVVADMEWGNDESHTFTVEKEPLDKYDQAKWQRFINGDQSVSGMFYILAAQLANDGFLTEGEYMIKISW